MTLGIGLKSPSYFLHVLVRVDVSSQDVPSQDVPSHDVPSQPSPLFPPLHSTSISKHPLLCSIWCCLRHMAIVIPVAIVIPTCASICPTIHPGRYPAKVPCTWATPALDPLCKDGRALLRCVLVGVVLVCAGWCCACVCKGIHRVHTPWWCRGALTMFGPHDF